MRILNLYPGIGGNRKLWGNGHEIVSVELNEEIAAIYKDLFPNDTMIIADAHEYLRLHIKDDWDFIWSSPPCQSHSRMKQCRIYAGGIPVEYPELDLLYGEIIVLRNFAPKKTKFVVENVIPYYPFLIQPDCIIGRHAIWANFPIRNRTFEKEISTEKTSSITTRFGFNISKYKIKHRKDQILRNLVDPKIGKHILYEANLANNGIF